MDTVDNRCVVYQILVIKLAVERWRQIQAYSLANPEISTLVYALAAKCYELLSLIITSSKGLQDERLLKDGVLSGWERTAQQAASYQPDLARSGYMMPPLSQPGACSKRCPRETDLNGNPGATGLVRHSKPGRTCSAMHLPSP